MGDVDAVLVLTCVLKVDACPITGVIIDISILILYHCGGTGFNFLLIC